MSETPQERTQAATPARHGGQSAGGGGAGGGNAVYGLGLIGALVYFVQQAHGFGEYVLAVLKALVWPALLVYEAFRAAHGQ